jgi:5-formyltetrahydrofolate cyclo-ligase
MLHTVLFKSEKNRIGFAIEFYDDLLKLLTERFASVDRKLEGLTEKERYIVKLMLDGVQLETLIPKGHDGDSDAVKSTEKLRKLGLPLTIHNQGRDNETTLIATGSNL